MTAPDQRPLAGKRVVVTGSGRGVGAALAIHAAELGASVVVNDLEAAAIADTLATIEGAAGRAIGCPADIATEAGADSVIGACVDAFGGIDGLVNNAGLFLMGTGTEPFDEAKVRAMVNVNLFGTVYCGMAAMRHMVAAGSGSIVNVTSGAQVGLAGMGMYGATKGAVASLTFAWAAELKGSGVRCNALSPLADSRLADINYEYLEAHGQKVARVPLPEPSNNAPVVAYLLSDRSAAVNGQVVRIEGPSLSTMTHPAVWGPLLTRDKWRFDDIVEAFEGELGRRLAPLGAVAMRPEYIGWGSEHWRKTSEAQAD